MLTWGEPNERYYFHGLDRGVIYPKNEPPLAWNGLTGLDESSDAEREIFYRDGIAYFADITPGDFEASVKALYYPPKFSKYLGLPEVVQGLYVDNQKPKRFGLSYRSLVGSGAAGDKFGYQIHLVYNALTVLDSRRHETSGEITTPEEFTFDIICTPVSLPGYKPSAHYILDTRRMDKTLVRELEELLYGTETTEGRLPTPLELYEMMNFGDTITVKLNANDTVRITGSSDYVTLNADNSARVTEINAVDNGDGTYTISDGGNTVIVS